MMIRNCWQVIQKGPLSEAFIKKLLFKDVKSISHLMAVKHKYGYKLYYNGATLLENIEMDFKIGAIGEVEEVYDIVPFFTIEYCKGKKGERKVRYAYKTFTEIWK